MKDDEAWLALHGRIDDVMYGIMSKLEVPIPVRDLPLCHFLASVPTAPSETV